jgi:hypothetical protein
MWQTCERKAGFIDQVMRGQVTGRDLDDVGDAVLSYAEVKALATGNPLVIEQAGIQAELAKLERLARAHQDEQRRLARTAAASRAEAARRRADAARYDAALARRVDTSGDRFAMEIGGRRYTKRVDAGRELTRLVRQALTDLDDGAGARHEPPAQTIGHLGGFHLRLDGHRVGVTTEVRVTLAIDYEGNGPDLRLRLEDISDRRPDTLVTQLEGRLRRLQAERDRATADAGVHARRADEADTRTGHAFAGQHRLEQLRHRYDQIIGELSVDPTEESPDSGYPGCCERPRREPHPLVAVADELEAPDLG